MSNGHPVDIHWTGGTIPSGQRILMANLDMSVAGCRMALVGTGWSTSHLVSTHRCRNQYFSFVRAPLLVVWGQEEHLLVGEP